MPPRDPLYLADITEAAGHVQDFLQDLDQHGFLASELVRSAVLQKLSVIGEAANRLTPELKAAHPEVPWRSIIGLRNIAVHAYFSIKWETIWETATQDVPALALQISSIQAQG
ncbi:MAG: hypothetical protein JWM80_809 [Cyanobacteria bacterium RYN_339]|nr:hypothetical protein [Cyanobacteria bacterium RYN_339]